MAPHIIRNPRERIEAAGKHLSQGNLAAAQRALRRATVYLGAYVPMKPPEPARHTRPMHVALDSKNRIQATWYRGCVSTYPGWKKACRNLGYKTVKVQVVFPW